MQDALSRQSWAQDEDHTLHQTQSHDCLIASGCEDPCTMSSLSQKQAASVRILVDDLLAPGGCFVDAISAQPSKLCEVTESQMAHWPSFSACQPPGKSIQLTPPCWGGRRQKHPLLHENLDLLQALLILSSGVEHLT